MAEPSDTRVETDGTDVPCGLCLCDGCDHCEPTLRIGQGKCGCPLLHDRRDEDQDEPDDGPDIAACRICGCTDTQACDGGCWWVPDPWQHRDLCSACLPPDPGEPVDEPEPVGDDVLDAGLELLADLRTDLASYHLPIAGEPARCTCGAGVGCCTRAQDLAPVDGLVDAVAELRQLRAEPRPVLTDEFGILDDGETEAEIITDGDMTLCLDNRTRGTFGPSSNRPARLVRRQATAWREIPGDGARDA